MRQFKIIQDRYGRLWLGPVDADPERDLEAQGCWRCWYRDPQDLVRGPLNGAAHQMKPPAGK